MCDIHPDMKTFLSITFLQVLEMIIVGTTEVSNTYLVQRHTTWSSAIQSCNMKGGSLLSDLEIKDLVFNKTDSNNLQYEDVWQVVASPEFWVKEFKYKSPWLSAKGCFFGSPSDTSTTVTPQSNSVGTCYQRCSHSVYFGTQGKFCSCFSETEFRGLTEVKRAMCNVPCPGNVRERCGGAGFYDVYQTVDIFPYAEPRCHKLQDCDCVGLRCVNSDLVYFSDNCQENHSSGCVIGRSLAIGPFGDWSTSFNTCVSLTSKYPLPTLDEIQLSSLCGNKVWIGIYRLTLVSKGIVNCPYCRVGEINGTDLLCTVAGCHSFRTSICRYRENNTPESRMFTTTVCFGVLIGVLIGVSSCVPMVIFLKLKRSRQRHNSGTGESAQVYFTASGNPRASHVYEGLDQNEYVEPI